jgi:hypothetical protein
MKYFPKKKKKKITQIQFHKVMVEPKAGTCQERRENEWKPLRLNF